MSTWSQSAPLDMVLAHSRPRVEKSAERIDGAMIVFGAIFVAVAKCLQRLCRLWGWA